MREIERVDDSLPFRQGDVIRFAKPEMDTEDYAVILTADCDIANDKFGDAYSILPIVSAQHFLSRIWLRNRLRSARERAARLALEKARDALSRRVGNSAVIDEVTFDSLLSQKSDAALAEVFGLSNDKAFLGSLSTLRLRPDDYLPDQFSETMNTLFKGNARREAENALRQMGYAYFYFNYLPDNTRIGNIILLRQMSIVETSRVAKNRMEMKISGPPVAAFRVGRFRAEFKHAIAQGFASLFSRIGLPEEFEAECDDAWCLVVQELLS